MRARSLHRQLRGSVGYAAHRDARSRQAERERATLLLIATGSMAALGVGAVSLGARRRPRPTTAY